MKRKLRLHRRLRVVLVLLLLLAAAGCQRRRFERELAQAEQLRLRGEAAAAKARYEQLAAFGFEHPDLPLVLFRLADLENFQFHQPDAALGHYERIAATWPRHPLAEPALERRAELLAGRGRFAEAAAQYQRLLDAYPDSAERDRHRVALGESYFRGKAWGQADAVLAEFVAERGSSPLLAAALRLLAELHFLEREPARALAYYDRLLAAQPEPARRVEVEFNRGLCYEELGEFSKALEIYTRILREYPNPEVIRHKIERLKERRSRAGRG